MKKFLIIFGILIFNALISQPANAIKIGLETLVDQVGVGTDVKGRMISVHTNKTVLEVDGMRGYILVPYKDQIAVYSKGEYYPLNTDSLVLRPDSAGYVSAKGRWYRGKLMVKMSGGKLIVINDVELEDYIKGVVPAEMPPSWESEALKAQAIAARSYALANLGKQSRYGYDLKDNTEDQAYGGASAETVNTNDAVKETDGIVLVYDGKIIPAFFYFRNNTERTFTSARSL